MELKEYQQATLDSFTRWLEQLTAAQAQSAASQAALEGVGVPVPEAILNYPKSAWETLAQEGGVAATAGPYVNRTDEAGRPIPHICLKVPTGGGKTLLAAGALERLNRRSGLVLWMVPSHAIYTQTNLALRSRVHHVRDTLERASGGRVKILSKDDLFSRADIENYLCVMLISMQSANREKNKDYLKIFRDSGRYPTIFPDSDDPLGDARLLNECPDLERQPPNTGPVKHSLVNAFKMLRPVIVLDEAHKAYGRQEEHSQEFVRAVNRLDPSLVIELSATPNKQISNLLVDITGSELKAEEMIKLPVQVNSFTNAEWQYTLGQVHDELERLKAQALSLQMNGGDYIRPIAVVRVERTGKDQRDGERVHAEDVRDYLIRTLGVPETEVAVKSQERDELAGVNLLSEYTPVRWIITRAALMEGWDCPFAYVLVMLDNTNAQRALTQLVGRVMRQPYARRTGQAALDQCYVYCWNTDVGKAVSQVKNGLEQEGLNLSKGDVAGAASNFQMVTATRRKEFRKKNIYLPMVLHQENDAWRELDYSLHIQSGIDWDAITAQDIQGSLPDKAQRHWATVDVGPELPVFHDSQELFIDKTTQVNWFARRLADVLPNPWQAGRVVSQLLDSLAARGESEEEIYDRRSYLAYALREYVSNAVQEQAELIFKDKLHRGEIRFDLEAGQPNFKMLESYEIPVPEGSGLMTGKDGRQLRLNLFEPVYTHQFDSSLERSFARYLDEQKALQWWHRVAVRQRGDYYLRGWKQERIWPDFVAMAGETNGKPHVLVFETKGEHLRGNPDTDYKQRVLETLQNAFNCGKMVINDGPAKGTFRLVFSEAEFPAALEGLKGLYNAAQPQPAEGAAPS